jgi:protein-tyrosine-phosphatase
MTRILFVCHGNTCRSVLAEHIGRKKFGRDAEFTSAGLHPGSVDDTKSAIFTLKSLFDIDASGHRPRDIHNVDVATFDLVVALDTAVAKEFQTMFPSFPSDHLKNWKIKDPYGDDLTEYQKCASDINVELRNLSALQRGL